MECRGDHGWFGGVGVVYVGCIRLRRTRAPGEIGYPATQGVNTGQRNHAVRQPAETVLIMGGSLPVIASG